MDREKAPESENFQTLFLQMGNQITRDPGGHAPDGVAPVEHTGTSTLPQFQG